jgi:hypothetical protein
MSGEITATDEEDEEFHSAFDLGFGYGVLDTFKWLIAGHLLYVVGLLIAASMSIEMGNIWVTPLFGLPLLWAERKHRPWLKALVFVIGFTSAHYCGEWIAIKSYQPSAELALLPGLWGGLLGGGLALAACFVLGLCRPGVPTMVLGLFGLGLLGVAGALGVYMYVSGGPASDGPVAAVMHMLWIYTPWQVVFAYVLAKVLRPVAR